jgi:hypothetical protein
MASFSERNGLVTRTVQYKSIDDPLRNSLWNIIWEGLNDKYNNDIRGGDEALAIIQSIFGVHWHKPVDELYADFHGALKQLRGAYFALHWNETLDLLEFLAPEWERLFNAVLKMHLSAYRLIEHKVVEVTDEGTIKSIEGAIEASTPYSGVRAHLNAAIACLAKRPDADYPNTMKEAISAVEALVGLIVNKPGVTMGDGVKDLAKHLPIHPALVRSWSALYGYTSEEPGVRHGSGAGVPKVGHAEAMHMLVTCSAIVSYLIELKIEQRS